MENLGLPNAICAEVDVTDLDSFRPAINKGEERFGKVECLINNAGVLFADLASQQDPKDWKKMIDVNLIGVLNGVHLVLKDMVERQTGTIVNVSSVAGRKTSLSFAIYCATKHALHALTETIREEVATNNVRVINIAPGNVKTEIWDHAVPEEKKHLYSAYQRKDDENLSSNTIAEAILFSYDQPQSVCIRELVIAPTKQIK